MRSVVAVGTVLRADEGSVLVPTGPAGPDHQAALTLHGSALPPVGTRVVIEGGLVGRSLHVVQWRGAGGYKQARRARVAGGRGGGAGGGGGLGRAAADGG